MKGLSSIPLCGLVKEMKAKLRKLLTDSIRLFSSKRKRKWRTNLRVCESLIKSPWAQILSALRVAKCYIIITGGMVSIVLWKLLERHWLLCLVKRTAWFRRLDAKSPHLFSTEPRSLESPFSQAAQPKDLIIRSMWVLFIFTALRLFSSFLLA